MNYDLRHVWIPVENTESNVYSYSLTRGIITGLFELSEGPASAALAHSGSQWM